MNANLCHEILIFAANSNSNLPLLPVGVIFNQVGFDESLVTLLIDIAQLIQIMNALR